MKSATLLRALRQPSVWIVAAFFALVVVEIYFWMVDRGGIPGGLTGSILYRVPLALCAYYLVFRGTDHYRNLKALLTALSFGIAVASLFLLSKRPKLFDKLSTEDGFVENLSAAALFIGAAVFVVLLVRQLRSREWLPAAISGLFAVVLFVIGMEEISWMQRIIGFETSDFFLERNIQNEANLHNLDTGATEKVFYFGGFFVLILLPFFHRQITEFLTRLGHLRLTPFAPAAWLLLPSSLIVGYVGTSPLYDPSGTIGLVVTGLILFRLAVAALDGNSLPKFLIYSAFLLLMGTMAYYFTTYNYALVEIRSWARKEYLELIIALGLMSYAIGALQHHAGLPAAGRD